MAQSFRKTIPKRIGIAAAMFRIMLSWSRLVQPLALTLGEPAGIGPDLALAIWRRRAELDMPPFYIVGDPDFLAPPGCDQLGLDVPIANVTPATAAAAFRSALPVVASRHRGHRRTGPPGSIERARRGRFDPPRGRRRHGRRGGRRRHQSDRQERALQLGLCRARPYRIPGHAGAGSDRRNRCGR